MHSTDNLEDEYIGSGRRLWLSINKHGRENHNREILEFLESRQALKNRETQLVNEDVLKDPMCMNLVYGGGGGFISKDGCKKGARNRAIKLWSDPVLSKRRKEQISEELKERWTSPEYREKMMNHISWTGKHHTEETKKKIGIKNSEANAGCKNNGYGKHWMTHPTFGNKRVDHSSIPEYINNGWKIGLALPKKEQHKITKICESCGESFEIPYTKRKQKTCSLSCSTKLSWNNKIFRKNRILSLRVGAKKRRNKEISH